MGTMRKRRNAAKESAREEPVRADRKRLAREVAKLDPKSEQVMAEEGMRRDFEEWPGY